MKNVLLLFFCSFFIINLSAQNRFEKNQIITKDGDTLYCNIVYDLKKMIVYDYMNDKGKLKTNYIAKRKVDKSIVLKDHTDMPNQQELINTLNYAGENLVASKNNYFTSLFFYGLSGGLFFSRIGRDKTQAYRDFALVTGIASFATGLGLRMNANLKKGKAGFVLRGL